MQLAGRKDMNELERKNELIKAMTASELAIPAVQEELAVQTYSKIPVTRIAAVATGSRPVPSAAILVKGILL